MIQLTIELGDHCVIPAAALHLIDAMAKINAQEFARQGLDSYPCCTNCAGWKIQPSAPLQDAHRLRETHAGPPASVVAYAMGRELARGQACRAVLLDDHCGYEREDGKIVEPVKGECDGERCTR